MALHRRLPRTAASVALPAASLLSFVAISMTAAPVMAQSTSSAAQLRVLSPRAGDSVGSSSFSMDVSFQAVSKANPIATAELWVDGARWVRQDLTTPQVKNVLKFQVDGSTLSAGTHAIIVRVFTANGSSAQTQISIEAGNNNGVSTGAFSGPEMRFAAPGNGKRVQGTVEITIDAKPRNGQDPYVTFYVDKKFKTLKNYPPYTLTWDSTEVSNGFHTIEAMGYLDSANASTTTKLKVYVDNAGGNTVRLKEIPDLRTASAKKAPLVLGHTSSSVAAGATPAALTAPTTEALVTLPGASGYTLAAKDTLKAVPETAYLASAANQTVRAISPLDLGTTETPAATSNLAQSPIADSESATASGLASPKLAMPTVAGSTTLADPTMVIKSVKPAASVSSATPRATASTPLVLTHRASAPKTTLAAPAVVRTAAKRAASRMTAGAPRAGVKAMPSLYSFSPVQVAFDGEQIAFDVQPRVEAGLPMAPFRQIFEHTGGQVQWVSSTKVLRAVNSDREIVIKVGKDKAMVNGESFKLDRAAFLEQGRTIVPLSFVGKALDVNVQYDPATGRLQITSK